MKIRRITIRGCTFLLAAVLWGLPVFSSHAAKPAQTPAAAPASAKQTSSSASDSFYQKLKKGRSVRIAVLGDSIADKTGVEPSQSWDFLLYEWLSSEYSSKVTLDSYAIGGTTSYTGYYECETAMRAAVKKSGAYDLVIICYGQNDAPENFTLYYEGLLRSVRTLNRSCQLITILESSQQIYTEKMLEIIRLSGLYHADVADTISAFARSPLSYEQLTPDGTHPNAEGHRIYFEALCSIIEENMSGTGKPAGLPPASSPFVTLFENFSFIPLEKCRASDGQYRFTAQKPALGIVYKKFPGASDIRLEFSSGEVWADTGNTTILREWTTAAPVGLLVAPGTVITLIDEAGGIEDTVLGFITSGYLPQQ